MTCRRTIAQTSLAVSSLLIALFSLGGAEDKPSDARAILGYWQCTEATFKGKHLPECVGEVYRFKSDGELEIHARDSWSRWRYRLDATKQPKEIVWSLGFAKDEPEIYELTRDRLRIRSADKPQSLSFARQPKGRWNEAFFKRISEEEAQTQIEKLKEEWTGEE